MFILEFGYEQLFHHKSETTLNFNTRSKQCKFQLYCRIHDVDQSDLELEQTGNPKVTNVNVGQISQIVQKLYKVKPFCRLK